MSHTQQRATAVLACSNLSFTVHQTRGETLSGTEKAKWSYASASWCCYHKQIFAQLMLSLIIHMHAHAHIATKQYYSAPLSPVSALSTSILSSCIYLIYFTSFPYLLFYSVLPCSLPISCHLSSLLSLHLLSDLPWPLLTLHALF